MKETFTLAPFRLSNQLLFSTGGISFNLMERMILLYAAYYYLPPKEVDLPELISNERFWGFFTTLGMILLVGNLIDAFSDAIAAQISDNSKSKIGRRKIFMLIGAVPLVLSALLVFYPPVSDGVSNLNAWWFGLMIGIFYLGFTAYSNPYLALIAELGQTNEIRINMSTFVAFFGLIGMVMVMVVFPLVVGGFRDAGYDAGLAYKYTALIYAGIACFFAYIATFSFKECKHCYPVEPIEMSMMESFKKTLSIKHFRIFLCGEIFVYFCVNIITLGMLYYAVVIFKGGSQLGIEMFMGEQFMMVIAGAALLVAIMSFPFINKISKKIGKKKVLLFGIGLLCVITFLLFIMSFNMTGPVFYVGLVLFAMAGFPLAALSTMPFSLISDIAREDAMRTGKRREGMFYGVRAIPLKMSTAIAGMVFGFLISTYGKDINEPLGIQLSLIIVSVMALLAFLFFLRFPEKEVMASLELYEKEKYS